MRIRTTVPAAALLLIASLAWPSSSEASHRHSLYCGHRSAVYDGYRAPHYRHGYSYRPRGYGHGWSYGYRPPVYYGAPPVYYGAPPVYYGAPPVYAPYGYSYDYDYRYRSPYAYSPYRYGRPLVSLHYHGRLSCRRPHVSLHVGF